MAVDSRLDFYTGFEGVNDCLTPTGAGYNRIVGTQVYTGSYAGVVNFAQHGTAERYFSFGDTRGCIAILSSFLWRPDTEPRDGGGSRVTVNIWELRSAGYTTHSIYWHNNGNVGLYDGSHATGLITPAVVGNWYWIQVLSRGWNIPILRGWRKTITGGATIGPVNAGTDATRIGYGAATGALYGTLEKGSSAATGIMYYDDISEVRFFDDGFFTLPLVRMLPLTPNADGTYTGWTASAGNRWDCIDEIPISYADYIYTTNLDTYSAQLTDFTPPGWLTAYRAVAHNTVARYSTDPLSLGLRLQFGVDDYAGDGEDYPQTTLSGDYRLRRRTFRLAPDGNAWDDARLDSLQWILKKDSTNAFQSRCAHGLVQVALEDDSAPSLGSIPGRNTSYMFTR